ncbi:MAG: ribosome silencing factor [Clostridia bacterium]|nr:ribosome silencing factor [Clostridia bacterium]
MDRVKLITQALYDKKAKDIVALDITNVTSLGNYFIICSCTSSTQLRACTDEVEEKMKEAGINLSHKEGYRGGTWILMDYEDVIVHIMLEETREFYSLEKLWSDAKRIDLDLK